LGGEIDPHRPPSGYGIEMKGTDFALLPIALSLLLLPSFQKKVFVDEELQNSETGTQEAVYIAILITSHILYLCYFLNKKMEILTERKIEIGKYNDMF
jgi:hypothetical protein